MNAMFQITHPIIRAVTKAAATTLIVYSSVAGASGNGGMMGCSTIMGHLVPQSASAQNSGQFEEEKLVGRRVLFDFSRETRLHTEAVISLDGHRFEGESFNGVVKNVTVKPSSIDYELITDNGIRTLSLWYVHNPEHLDKLRVAK